MNELKDYVDFRLTHSDKLSEAQGYPLELSDCKKHKPMRDLKIYGNSYQGGTPSPDTPIEVQSVGEFVTDESDVNYGKYKISIVQRGIHAVNPKTFVGGTLVDNGGGSYTLTRTASERFGAYNRKVQSIPIGTKLILKANILHTNFKTPRLTVMIKYTDDTIHYLNISNSYAHTFTVSKQLNFIVFYVHTDEAVGSYITFNELILGYSDNFTEYEPYVEQVTTNIYLNEPLHKLGDYADYIDFKNNQVVRKCVKKYLSNYNWNSNYISKFTNGSYGFLTEDRSIVPDYYDNLPKSAYAFSNVFPLVHNTNYGSYAFVLYVSTWSSNVRVAVPAEYLTEISVSALKSWLKENDAYMICIRKTPTEEPLNLDLPKLNAKTTIIEVDTSLAPSNIYGKYIKK